MIYFYSNLIAIWCPPELITITCSRIYWAQCFLHICAIPTRVWQTHSGRTVQRSYLLHFKACEYYLSKRAAFVVDPLSPSVRCGVLTSHTFELIIDRPRQGRVDKYDIICAACRVNITVAKDASATKTKHTIRKLKPFTEYVYEVKSVREADNGLRKGSVVVDGTCKTTIGRK